MVIKENCAENSNIFDAVTNVIQDICFYVEDLMCNQ